MLSPAPLATALHVFVVYIFLVRSQCCFLGVLLRGLTGQLRESNLDAVVQKLGKVGYSVECFKMHSVKFGLPQNRVRVYIVGVRTQSLSKADVEFFSCLKACITAMQFEGPHLESWYCLGPGHIPGGAILSQSE